MSTALAEGLRTGRTGRAAGIPPDRWRATPRRRRPHPAGRWRLLQVSNDPAHDPRRPFWLVGRARDRRGNARREWHASAEAVWTGAPPAGDGASWVPSPALGLLVGEDLRGHPEACAILPVAISWDHGDEVMDAGVVWYDDGSTLPLETCCALLDHTGAGDGTDPFAGLSWTSAPGRPLVQAEHEGTRVAMLVRLKRSAARDAEAAWAVGRIDARRGEQR